MHENKLDLNPDNFAEKSFEFKCLLPFHKVSKNSSDKI